MRTFLKLNNNSVLRKLYYSNKVYFSKYRKHPACDIYLSFLQGLVPFLNHKQDACATLFLNLAPVGASPCGCPKEDLRKKRLNSIFTPFLLKTILYFILLTTLTLNLNSQEVKKTPENQETVKCGKITYSKSKTSVCFSDYFLSEINSKTSIKTDIQFSPVKLDSNELFDYPFCVISGEDSFTLTEKEKANLKKYLLNGGFILASPGCSNAEWNKSFRQALASIFPEKKLLKLDMSHPIFSVFYKIDKLTLKNGGTTQIEGLEIDGRIALVYSMEGLNDVANAKGCCCCGGNEIKECQQMNINIFLYAMLF